MCYRQSNSPSLRRRTEDVEGRLAANAAKDKESRRRSNLEVPRASYAASTSSGSGGAADGRKSEAGGPCIALNVPRTNIVTPWDGNDES